MYKIQFVYSETDTVIVEYLKTNWLQIKGEKYIFEIQRIVSKYLLSLSVLIRIPVGYIIDRGKPSRFLTYPNTNGS